MLDASIVQICDIKFTSKLEVIRYLADMAYKAKKIGHKESFIQAVLKREKETSTAVGYAIAIPHGAADTVLSSFLACLNLQNPIVWDGEETNLIFLIGVPLSHRNKEHLKILAMLSRHLMNEEFRRRLQNATSADEMYQIIRTVKEEKEDL